MVWGGLEMCMESTDNYCSVKHKIVFLELLIKVELKIEIITAIVKHTSYWGYETSYPHHHPTS